MSNPRRFQLEELTLRPGTYFNPQTEVMIVVDDSPEIDHEIFESQDFEADEWVLISEDAPVDESKRDDIVERFQLSHGTNTVLSGEEDFDDLDDDDDDDENEEDDELDGDEDLDFDDE
jgi:hypothetical protein